MTEKRYDVVYEKEPRGQVVTDNGIPCTARTCVTRLNRLTEENEQLKQFQSRVFDTIDAFIEGVEDEKGIDETNQEFQNEMNRALKYLKALKRELKE